VYREVFPPKNELFKSVGHNSQALVKEIMTLMNKIPANAARSAKLKPFGSKLAKTLATKMKSDLDKKMTNNLLKSVTASKLVKSDSFKELQEDSANVSLPSISKTDADKEVDEAVNIMTQVYAKTNKHYRRFFEDELENDKVIFPKPIFHNFDIKRGQSRGVEKSWFSFGGG